MDPTAITDTYVHKWCMLQNDHIQDVILFNFRVVVILFCIVFNIISSTDL